MTIPTVSMAKRKAVDALMDALRECSAFCGRFDGDLSPRRMERSEEQVTADGTEFNRIRETIRTTREAAAALTDSMAKPKPVVNRSTSTRAENNYELIALIDFRCGCDDADLRYEHVFDTEVQDVDEFIDLLAVRGMDWWIDCTDACKVQEVDYENGDATGQSHSDDDPVGMYVDLCVLSDCSNGKVQGLVVHLSTPDGKKGFHFIDASGWKSGGAE
jgi:hypothetical protein